MNWKTKLTSRKFWVALAGLVVGVIALLGIKTDTSQITGVIMALGSVIAYIVGEGLVDAASAGATTVINGSPTITAGQAATMPDPTPVIGTVDPAPAEGAPTGAVQATAVKTDTALSSTPADAPAASDGETGAPAASVPQAATQPESGAVVPGTTGAE